MAGWSKLLSATLNAAHALLAIEIGAITACVFLFAGKGGNKLSGIAAASAFLALLLSFTHRLYMNHRWDSACCVVISAALLLISSRNPVWGLLAGIFAGSAVLFTPPTLLVAAVIVICLLSKRGFRRDALLFAAGVGIPILLAAAVLALGGSIVPMLERFAWVSLHYKPSKPCSLRILAARSQCGRPCFRAPPHTRLLSGSASVSGVRSGPFRSI
ncbi:MAG: hypothetical protein M3Y24_01430 [Acidobacteriota bacterium]|nr:hypothetical protein [Acidobacteriota bacterium]